MAQIDAYEVSGAVFNVSGWGALSSGGGSPDTLHVVTVPFISDSVCQAKYNNPPPGYSPALITEQMICAGNAAEGGILIGSSTIFTKNAYNHLLISQASTHAKVTLVVL